MSTESAQIRRDKRIVEHIISGFSSAKEATIFANTVERLIMDSIGKGEFLKFKHSVGAPNTTLAITSEWIGPTVLKTTFLEVNQNLAMFICDVMKKTISSHEEVHKTLLQVHSEVVREKPQPQFIG